MMHLLLADSEHASRVRAAAGVKKRIPSPAGSSRSNRFSQAACFVEFAGLLALPVFRQVAIC
jgi:hypothetical protein